MTELLSLCMHMAIKRDEKSLSLGSYLYDMIKWKQESESCIQYATFCVFIWIWSNVYYTFKKKQWEQIINKNCFISEGLRRKQIHSEHVLFYKFDFRMFCVIFLWFKKFNKDYILQIQATFLIIFYCLCYYSCPNFSPFDPLHPAPNPFPQAIPLLLFKFMGHTYVFFGFPIP